ncbi:hypothetical protein E2562_022862 [Oryza meyeriana var. granulata]|uniref:Uncharacterized protein n=1 Tax=Oryza meyeriana var. granulata TaxID=110450 RepID=A0A6G1BN90_9ORYZ|nr:hypothetical protein E2562_022862 [Oryza meyeriana var. granulata]
MDATVSRWANLPSDLSSSKENRLESRRLQIVLLVAFNLGSLCFLRNLKVLVLEINEDMP